MLLNVYADRIEKRTAPEHLPAGRAVALQRVDLSTELLALARDARCAAALPDAPQLRTA